MNLKKFNVVGGLIAAIVVCTFVVEEASCQSYGPFGGTRPGDCPADLIISDDGTAVRCPKPCLSDCECPTGQRCCWSRYCNSQICMNPDNVPITRPTCYADIFRAKDGKCPDPSNIPVPVPSDGTACCEDKCTADCDCPDIQICCKSKSCGNVCTKPVLTSTPGEPQPVDPSIM